ncbi:MAG: MAPEG family protein [Myxococcota bacterium]
MNDSLFWLALTTVFTALMWMPYILNSFVVRGLMPTMSYPDDPPPLSPWAQRAHRAHNNAVQNLALFAPLVLALAILDQRGDAIAIATIVYFAARILHFVVYVAKIPLVRTVAFLTGWGAVVFLGIQLLTSLAAAG